jgi:aminocarboxymuconate-semialdehyde decarboxylase
VTVIDVHSHVTPPSFRDAVRDGGTWHTLDGRWGELMVPEFSIAPHDRIAKMDADGVDVHVLTVNNDFYQYGLDPEVTQEIARACNLEIAEMMSAHPTRFTGLATVPMQDVDRAVAEMRYAMTELGYRGVTINDHVNGATLDDPRFDPFWQAAETLGAVVFFHQCGPTLVKARTTRYALPNSIGTLVDRAVTFGTLVFGGVMDRFPDLKICLGHAGGYTAYGAARMDRAWEAARMGVPEFADARASLSRPPSEYLSRFYYDSCTYTEDTLRFLLDHVGTDRVVLGTDYPAPMVQRDPVGWLAGMSSITPAERRAITSENPARMLGL